MSSGVDTELPLRECAPWCMDGDGHSKLHPADRRCVSAYFEAPLTLGTPERGGNGSWRLPLLTVWLWRERTEVGAGHVVIHDEEHDHELHLTAQEARAMVEALQLQIGLLDD